MPIDARPAAWTPSRRDLWRRTRAHDLERATEALTFTGRLARDMGWRLEVARAGVEEHRCFCVLAAVSPVPVTPSEEVDEVRHQHLTSSRDDPTPWCRVALRCDLHHDPTAGGSAEWHRFFTRHADTLARHEAWFGPPPLDFWPGTAARFGRPRFRTVDRACALVLPVPAGLGRRRAGLACVVSGPCGPVDAARRIDAA